MPPTWTPQPRASSDRSVECSFDRSTAMRLVNIRPGRQMRFYLAALPFVLLAVAYFLGSNARLTENPNDKLLPALSRMAQAVEQMAVQAGTRTGGDLMLFGTVARLGRLGSGHATSTVVPLGL